MTIGNDPTIFVDAFDKDLQHILEESWFYLISILMIFALVQLNVWYWKRRAAMTPEERRQEDEDLREPGDW
jgi:cyanate permease